LDQLSFPEIPINAVTITVDGRDLTCAAGTSLAAALWNHGIRTLSHSHKYGRPRGFSCARGHCTNCLMRVDGVPNIRTCETTIRDGMLVTTQGAGPVYAAPMQRALSLGRRWVPVGFYYKWFTTPASLSRFFLERIRPLAGVGVLPDRVRELPATPATTLQLDSTQLDNTQLGHFETVIIGGGYSGLSAAGQSNETTLLIDDASAPGGQRWPALQHLAQDPAGTYLKFPSLKAAQSRLKNALTIYRHRQNSVQFMGAAKAIAGYRPNVLVVRQGDRLCTTSFSRLVWAAGALDQIGLFPGNDSPGLIGPRALYRLLARDGLEVSGAHSLIIGSGLDFWLSAALLAHHGARVTLVLTDNDQVAEAGAAIALGWPLHTGFRLHEISAVSGGTLQASFAPSRGTVGNRRPQLRFGADLAVICLPGKPAYDIPHQLGAEMILNLPRGGYVPHGSQDRTDRAFDQTLSHGHTISYKGETLGLSAETRVTS